MMVDAGGREDSKQRLYLAMARSDANYFSQKFLQPPLKIPTCSYISDVSPYTCPYSKLKREALHENGNIHGRTYRFVRENAGSHIPSVDCALALNLMRKDANCFRHETKHKPW